MPYHDPKTWAVGEKVRATDLNEQIRDNVDYLLNRPGATQLVNEGSDYTTSSTTFADVDATDLSKTITTAGGDVLVLFVSSIGMSTTGCRAYLDIMVDGALVGGDDGLTVVGYGGDAREERHNVVVAYLVTGLSAGSHTFKIQWKRRGSGTATMHAGAGTSDYDVHPFFLVKEV